MANYGRQAPHHPYPHQEELPNPETMAGLWQLCVHIGKFWRNDSKPEAMRSNLVVFVENRIQLNPNYLDEYVNAVEVARELVAELGEEQGYRKLFTDPEANISPPTTRLARARQRVSNEFVTLQLALGGFKAFGGATNYLGYIGGANIEGQTPYRPYEKRST
jgi:hypothetical protein